MGLRREVVLRLVRGMPEAVDVAVLIHRLHLRGAAGPSFACPVLDT